MIQNKKFRPPSTHLSYLDEDGDLKIGRYVLREVRNRRQRAGFADPIFIVLTGTSRHKVSSAEGGIWEDCRVVLEVRKAYGWKMALKIARQMKEENPTQDYNRFSVLGNGQDIDVVLCYCEEHIPQDDDLSNWEYG